MNGKALEARSGPKTAGQIRLPFFYGWLLVGVSFVTMAIGVNAHTAYSLLFPQILDEFGWDRGVTAGAFSFGFLVSAVVTPCVGWLTDRRGPRLVIETASRKKSGPIFHKFYGMISILHNMEVRREA
jgi:MFS family permease